MKARKIVGLSLVVALSLSCLATGCGNTSQTGKQETVKSETGTQENAGANMNKTGLPLVKEKETLKILAVIGDTEQASKDIKVLQEIEEQTNVHVEYENATGGAWKEKKGLRMASGSLPDAIMGITAFNDIDLLNYGTQGLFVPIEDLAKEYAPNFMHVLEQNADLKKQITAPDGHIYGIPAYDDGFVPTTQDIIYINQEWLTKLNLKAPTTYDELEAVLKAFKDKDPNGNGKPDEIPMSFMKESYASCWFASFGVYDNPDQNYVSTHISVKDGKVIFSAARQEYKEAIKYFNKLFAEGLIDKEAFTQDSKMFNSKLKSVPERLVGVFLGWRSTAWKVPGKKDNDYVAIGPLKGPSGIQKWTRYLDGGLRNRGSFVITSACKNKELAMRWADNMLSEENCIQTNTSYKIGVHLEKTQDGKYKIIRPTDPNRPGEDKLTTGAGEVWMVTKDMVNKFIDIPAHMQEKFALDKLYNNYYISEDEIYPKIFFDVKDSERIAELKADIVPFVNGLYAKWMMQGGIDAEWDGYIKKLKDMKLDELLQIYQKAYDNYKNVK